MRALISATIAALAVALQLTVTDRMSLPGAGEPNLVLVTVAALALAAGPMTGMLTGFAAGLALDIAPPAGHLVGEGALVFCLIGYACGLAAVGPSPDGLPEQDRSALFELGVTAAGAACGEALLAVLGVVLSDPSVTWAAIKHVLPFSVSYDVMLSPFVLLGVAAMLRLAGVTRAARALPHAPGPSRRSAGLPSAATAGAVRQLTGGKSPQLRFGERRDKAGGQAKPQAPQGRGLASAPKLRFGANVGASLLGGSVFARSGSGLAPSRPLPGGTFSRTGNSLLSRTGGAAAGRARALRGAAPAISFSRSRPGKPSAKGQVRIRRGALARSPSAARMRSAPAAGRAPRFRRPGLLARLGSVLRRPARIHSPGRGWASGSGKGWSGGNWSGGNNWSGGKALAGRRPGKGWITAKGPARARARRPARLRMKSRYRPGIGNSIGKMTRRRKGKFR